MEEAYLAEVAKSNQYAKFIISLIRAHYEPSELVAEKYGVDGVDEFKKTTDEVANYFDEIGKGQLASYIRVLNGDDANVFVPM